MTTLNPNALTTLARIKSELRIATTDTDDDEWICDQINWVSDAIEEYLHRTLGYDAAIVELRRGYGGTRLVLERPPVWTVADVEILDGSVLVQSVDVTEFTISEPKAGILERPTGWPWTAKRDGGTIAQNPIPGTEEKAIRVTYAGGWVLPNESDVTDVDRLPSSIVQAAILAVVTASAKRGRDQTIQSEKLETYSVKFGSAGNELVAEAMAAGLPVQSIMLLRPFRMVSGAPPL